MMCNEPPPHPLIPHVLATQIGVLPIKGRKVRFAVGPPDGVTSNSWLVETRKSGDVYIMCRDNFKDVKVSLHASGRWRMGFIETAVGNNPNLLLPGQNRAWEIWDKPPASLPETVIAFRLLFPTAELAVRPEQRASQDWSKVVHIEAALPGMITMFTLLITNGDKNISAEAGPNFCLASLDINNGLRAQLVAHAEPEGNIPAIIERSVTEALKQAEAYNIQLSDEAYIYFLGRFDDDSRYLVGARASRRELNHLCQDDM